MDVSGLMASTGDLDWIRQLTGMSQAEMVADSGMAVLDQVLEMQEQMAAQLLRTMGIGSNIDLLV